MKHRNMEATTNIFRYLLLAVAIGVVYATVGSEEAPVGKRVLVILDDLRIKSSHSLFFKSLEDRYTLTFAKADDKTVTLSKYGDWQYDHLILFAPKSEEIVFAPAATILEFIDAGGNILVAADSQVSDPIRQIATECNVEFDESDTFVIDHLHFDTADEGKHTLIASDNIVDANVIIAKKSVEAPVLFRGIGQDIEEDSELVFSVLGGYPTTYSHSPDRPIQGEVHVAGKKTVLVSALQARNNARVAFSGSLELFSDKFFNSPVETAVADGKTKRFDKSGNEQFAKQLLQWTFQERGILRYKNVKHHLVGETQTPQTYTIKQEIEYSIEIEEWNGRRWVPFVADDVQLEFRMLDPYIRTTLKHNGKGLFTTRFQLPDVYGIFTFKVEYIRKGYGFLTAIDRIPVRPFRHNEYERFITSAYPYYASAFSMLAGLFVFSWFFLYHRDSK